MEETETLQKLWEEVRDLSLGTTSQVDRLLVPPTPLHFLRDYVSPNKPCLISSAINHWPATTLWHSTHYLLDALSSSTVSLHLTPTGRADSVTSIPTSPSSLCFASAHVEQLPFPDALSKVLQSENGSTIAYLQQQNDCFRSEYEALGSDCEPHFSWASEALECLPDAVNLWIGNDLSETSFHKDHYENLYAVITGEKHFLLLPPTDFHRMYIREYPAAQYHYSQDKREFQLELEEPVRHVPWCSVNPYPSEEKEKTEFPLYFNGPKPFEVTVKAGERSNVVYSGSLRLHQDGVFARFINFGFACFKFCRPRYDMRFDIKYAYFNFLQSIPSSIHNYEASCRKVCTEPCSCISKDESNISAPLLTIDDTNDGEQSAIANKPHHHHLPFSDIQEGLESPSVLVPGKKKKVSYRSKVVDVTVMSLVSPNNQDNIPESRSRREAPVVESDGRSRHVLNITLVKLLKELGVGMDGLFLQVSDDAVSQLGGDEVGGEVSVEEDALDGEDEGAFVPPRLRNLHERHQMHSLVLRFFQQRLDPPPAVLESPEGFAVEQHPSHHSRHRRHRLQHHRTTTIPPLRINAPVTNNGGISSAAGSGGGAVFLVLLFLLVITHSHSAHSPRPHNREPHPRNQHFLRSLGWIPMQESRRAASENSSDPCLAACSSRRTTENRRREIARGNVARQRSDQPRSATAHHLQQTIDQTKEIGNCKSQ
nr:jmjC domain-containing protein 7 [Ipomoea batatas]